jgi:hypothetical protein
MHEAEGIRPVTGRFERHLRQASSLGVARGGQLIETLQHLGGLEHTAPLALVHQAHDACGE